MLNIGPPVENTQGMLQANLGFFRATHTRTRRNPHPWLQVWVSTGMGVKNPQDAGQYKKTKKKEKKKKKKHKRRASGVVWALSRRRRRPVMYYVDYNLYV